MLAASKFAEDNSNSPDLFCYKQPPQTTEPRKSNQYDDSGTDSTRRPAADFLEYSKKTVHRTTPSFTFGVKYKQPDNYSTPDPGAYNLAGQFPDKPRVPSVTLSSRQTWYKALFITKYK